MNLFLALFWLVLGVGVFIVQALNPRAGLRIVNSDYSIGWLCLFFFVFNMGRWLLTRRRRRQQVQEPTPWRDARPAPKQITDPQFDFSEKPAVDEKRE